MPARAWATMRSAAATCSSNARTSGSSAFRRASQLATATSASCRTSNASRSGCTLPPCRLNDSIGRSLSITLSGEADFFMLRKRPSRMKKSASPLSVMPSDRPMESFSLQGGRVHPDLEALLVLQDADVAVSSCDARLKALEPEVRALDEQIAAAERVVAQARAGIQAALDR